MTVYFGNQGQIELAAITTLGVSVKEGESPIGFFGTGFKFSVATLLRTGHDVEVWDGRELHKFGTRMDIIRGKQFQIVTLNDKDLGFTTELGRNWELWQAYRELRCNAMDEPHWEIDTHQSSPGLQYLPNRTVIAVTGEGISQAHRERRAYFLDAPMLHNDEGIGSVHMGESNTIFYRGVAILKLDKPTHYTYNLTEYTALTEDRTMANVWMLPGRIGRLIASMEDHEMVARCVMSPDSYLEEQATFSSVYTPSQAFMDVMRRNKSNMRANKRARDLYESLNPTEKIYEDVELDDHEKYQLERAIQLVWRAEPECKIRRDQIRIVANLGTGVLGLYDSHEERIMLTRESFKMGIEMVAGTVLEEWHHQNKGMKDESREYQNYLIQLLMRAAARLS